MGERALCKLGTLKNGIVMYRPTWQTEVEVDPNAHKKGVSQKNTSTKDMHLFKGPTTKVKIPVMRIEITRLMLIICCKKLSLEKGSHTGQSQGR